MPRPARWSGSDSRWMVSIALGWSRVRLGRRARCQQFQETVVGDDLLGDDVACDQARRLHVAEIGLFQTAAVEARRPLAGLAVGQSRNFDFKIRLLEIRAPQVGASEVGAPQRCRLEVGAG